MNKNFTLILLALFIGAFVKVNGQSGIIHGNPWDSSVYSFPANNPLTSASTKPQLQASLDTMGARLWQVGNTNKTYFADSGIVRGIMTDTANHYPDSANDYFILKIGDFGYSQIISFTHKYQTTAGKDGCIIEISNDHKATWQNVAGDCLDTVGWWGIHTENVYGKTDTLENGEPAFSGSSNGWQQSQIQFFPGVVVRTTGTADCQFLSELFLRFRFVSDSIPDSLDGWIIGNIKMNYDQYEGAVNELKKTEPLKVFPNPVTTDIVSFPALPNADRLTISFYDVMGKKCLQMPYQQQVNVSKLPTGVYSYRVNDDERQYSGRVVISK